MKKSVIACTMYSSEKLMLYVPLQSPAPWWNIQNSIFGFPKGSKFLKFAIEALFLSFALQPRQERVLFCITYQCWNMEPSRNSIFVPVHQST